MKNILINAATCVALHIGWYHPTLCIILIGVVLWIASGVYAKILETRWWNNTNKHFVNKTDFNDPSILLGPVLLLAMLEKGYYRQEIRKDFEKITGYTIAFQVPIKLQKVINLNKPNSEI